MRNADLPADIFEASDRLLRPDRNVTVHIERLVIDGIPLNANDGAQLRASLGRELTRLLQRDGLPMRGGGAVPALTGPPLQIPQMLRPIDLGRQIARNLHESLTRPL
jgi:hypothetical protein